MRWGGPQCPLSWDGVQRFLSVHMRGFPRINRTPQVCRPALQGLRCFVGEKLPGVGPSLDVLALAQLSA